MNHSYNLCSLWVVYVKKQNPRVEVTALEQNSLNIESNNLSNTKIIQAAISEVLNPTLGVTEQGLAVHKLVVQNGSPVVIHVDNSKANVYYVYFQIENEPYYFVIALETHSKKTVVFSSYIEAAVRVYLRICSTVLNPIQISEKINLIPTETRTIGETRFPQTPYLKFQENRWYFEPHKNIPGSLEDKLKSLLEKLEPSQSQIANLQDECEIYICICYKGYRDWMRGWHIDKESILRIAALGAEVDLDLYAYGEHDLPM